MSEDAGETRSEKSERDSVEPQAPAPLNVASDLARVSGGSKGDARAPSLARAKRRVVLVDFFWTRDQDPRVPLGHASLLTALRQRFSGEVRSVVLPVNAGELRADRVAELLLDHTRGVPPEDVDLAIGAYVWAESLIQQVLPLVRDGGFRGRIILGGPQISYAGPRHRNPLPSRRRLRTGLRHTSSFLSALR
jgi:hypothetical protein